MEINSTNVAQIIIQTHMRGINLNKNDINIMDGFKYGLYNHNKQPIYSEINDSIDFSKKYYKKDMNSFYINNGALGHLGVAYIVIKESLLQKSISTLITNIVIAIFLLYLCIAVIGFYLAKLFIYPIQSQREKLNNFIKDTTHELNTPLSALLLCVDSDNFYTEQNRNHIRNSTKKISNLYKDLTYLFLKNHQLSKVCDHNISDILLQELTYYTQLANKKKITIEHNIQNTLIKIEEDDFRRLINNLISNAIKYTKRNGKIKITLQNKILTIQDTGIGIEKEKLKKIFERYYRATNNIGGFGIGLNIVYSICKNYHIKIDVQSKLNEGTLFTLGFS